MLTLAAVHIAVDHTSTRGDDPLAHPSAGVAIVIIWSRHADREAEMRTAAPALATMPTMLRNGRCGGRDACQSRQSNQSFAHVFPPSGEVRLTLRPRDSSCYLSMR